MKASRPFRTLLILFALVLAFYLASFYGVEYLRHRKGPWVMRFDRATDGTPIVEISQPHLGINGTRIVFRGEVYTNAAAAIAGMVKTRRASTISIAACSSSRR